MTWLALGPLLGALVLLGTLVSRQAPLARLLQLAVVGTMLIAAGLVVLRLSWTRSARVVFLLDEGPEGRERRLAEAMRALSQPIAGYGVGVLNDPQVTATTATAATAGCAPWTDASDGGSTAVVRPGFESRDPNALVHWALDRFDEHCPADGWGARWWDLLSGRPHRLVIVMAHPERWAAFDLRSQTPSSHGMGLVHVDENSTETRSEVERLATQALRGGIIIDVLLPQSTSAVQPKEQAATLVVELPRWLPSGRSRIDATLTLRLEGVRPEELGPGGTRWRRRCEIDPGRTEAAPSSKEETVPVDRRGPVLVEKGVIGDLFAGGLDLSPGFHLVRCTVTLGLAYGRQLRVSGSSYAQAASLHVLMVAGHAGRFASHAAATVPGPEALRKAWNDLSLMVPRWYDAVPFYDEDWIDEKELCDRLVPKNARGASVRPRSRPQFLVLFDVDDHIFDDGDCAKRVADLVEDGLHVFWAGAPDKATAEKLGFVPAYAAAASHGGFWRYDRRPGLAFVRDPSRLGRLPYDPPLRLDQTPPAALPKDSPYLVDDAKLRELELESGEEIQERLIKAVEEQLTALTPEVIRSPSTSPVSPQATQATPVPVDDRAMWGAAQLEQRLTELEVQRAPRRRDGDLAVGDVVVLFTYDVSQHRAAASRLQELLDRGSSVFIVELKTPLGAAVDLQRVPSSQPVVELVRGLGARGGASAAGAAAEAPIRKEEARARLLGVFPLKVERKTKANAELDVQIRLLAQKIVKAVRERQTPERAFFVLHRFGRFLDERLGPTLPEHPVRGDFARLPRDDRWAGPALFQELQARPESVESVYASVSEDLHRPDALGPRPILIGGLYGRGEVLVAGYHPLEGALFKGLKEAAPFSQQPLGPTQSPTKPRQRIYTESAVDHWGPQRIIDFTGLATTLEPAPSEEPVVVALRGDAVKGGVEIDVLQRLKKGRGIDLPFLKTCTQVPLPGGGLSRELTCSRGEDVRPELCAIDPVRERVTYRLPPRAVHRLCGEEPDCVVELVQARSDDDLHRLPQDDEHTIYLLNPLASLTKESKPLPLSVDLRPQQALAAIARYSGGSEFALGDAIPPMLAAVDVRPRDGAAISLSLALATLWLLRLARRLRTSRDLTARQKSARRLGPESYPDTAGLDAGAVAAHLIATRRAGAAGGVRPWEPGDRLDSALLEDLVLMARRGGIIPRMVQRIDERVRRITFFLQVGRSMQVPAAELAGAGLHRPLPPKLAAGIRALEALGHLAWAAGAEIRIVLLGLAGRSESLGPYYASPGEGVLAKTIGPQAAARGAWQPRLPRFEEEAEHAQAIIYISDFLNEDHAALIAAATRAEQEGAAFGALCIYAPDEFRLIDIGVAPASGTTCDRSEWTPADLAFAHARFVQRLGDRLLGTRGGLAVVSAAWTIEELHSALSESRVLELVR